MGRVKEHNRKISNDRVKKEREQKYKILIAVEGNNKTEKLYFSNFEDRSKPYNITFAKGNNTDPLNLVKMLIKEIKDLDLDLKDGDVAYCIFDTDMDSNKNKVIEEGIPFAEGRRLFYVALTRTKNHVYLLCDKNLKKDSEFISEIYGIMKSNMGKN